MAVANPETDQTVKVTSEDNQYVEDFSKFKYLGSKSNMYLNEINKPSILLTLMMKA